MKVKVISRSEESFTRERSGDVGKVFKNLDPKLHPMERAHEYTRALNAVKLDKVFAKPFVAALSGHRDGVSCMAKNPRRLNCLVSGAMDGEVKLWDLAYRRTVAEFPGHRGAVRGVSISNDGDFLVSCGDDSIVRLWNLPPPEIGEVSTGVKGVEPVMVYQGKNSFRGVDHHWGKKMFATVGAKVELWDYDRSEPVSTFSWGSETVVSVRFDPAEPDVFVTTGSDRSICLYDLRMNTPLRKVIMRTRTNAVAWNPREPLNFTAANEDTNCYTYDMRNLSSSKCIHKDHVSAVMDLDYSPTGREFVTGSYDRTVRIFSYNGGHSREVYHTKRMQRVFSVRFSGDASYVLSGSDDTNIRVWKARASEQLGVILPRERAKQEYAEAVKKRYKHLEEVKRIDRHRQLPKAVFKAKNLRQEIISADRKRENRKRAHSAPGSIPHEPARKKRIVAELE